MIDTCKRCGAVVEFTGDTNCAWCTLRLEEIAAEKAHKPKRHTYINTLQEQVAEKDARIVELEEQIESIVTYLALEKFAPPSNSWVSKYDILRMLGRY